MAGLQAWKALKSQRQQQNRAEPSRTERRLRRSERFAQWDSSFWMWAGSGPVLRLLPWLIGGYVRWLLYVRRQSRSLGPKSRPRTCFCCCCCCSMLLMLTPATTAATSLLRPQADHSRIPKCKDSGSQEGRPNASSPARSINPEIQIHSRLVMARVLFLLPSYGNLSQ